MQRRSVCNLHVCLFDTATSVHINLLWDSHYTQGFVTPIVAARLMQSGAHSGQSNKVPAAKLILGAALCQLAAQRREEVNEGHSRKAPPTLTR